MERRDRRCCCGCGEPVVYIVEWQGPRRIDLGFAAACRDKYDAARDHFRKTYAQTKEPQRG